jgi:hypothetical protein
MVLDCLCRNAQALFGSIELDMFVCMNLLTLSKALEQLAARRDLAEVALSIASKSDGYHRSGSRTIGDDMSANARMVIAFLSCKRFI